jgi:hypothetical protein
MSDVLATMVKSPADVLDYDLDFGRWMPDNDQIFTATAAIEDSTVTFVIDSVITSQYIAKVWVSGGADGEQGEISVEATTLGGRTKEVRFRLRIVDDGT